MRSATRGKRTSDVEITNLSKHGFWILVEDRELFAPFDEFPWFKQASVDQILKVEMPGPGHLYWPDLDVDLAIESLESPTAFPLVSRIATITPPRKPKAKRKSEPKTRSGEKRS
jgi:Protein of unknown function (DUF2442)